MLGQCQCKEDKRKSLWLCWCQHRATWWWNNHLVATTSNLNEINQPSICSLHTQALYNRSLKTIKVQLQLLMRIVSALGPSTLTLKYWYMMRGCVGLFMIYSSFFLLAFPLVDILTQLKHCRVTVPNVMGKPILIPNPNFLAGLNFISGLKLVLRNKQTLAVQWIYAKIYCGGNLLQCKKTILFKLHWRSTTSAVPRFFLCSIILCAEYRHPESIQTDSYISSDHISLPRFFLISSPGGVSNLPSNRIVMNIMTKHFWLPTIFSVNSMTVK